MLLVTGSRGSGRTTVASIIAAALREAGAYVLVSDDDVDAAERFGPLTGKKICVQVRLRAKGPPALRLVKQTAVAMSGRPRIVTFFVVRIPPGSTARAWGHKHARTYGFDYDHEPSHKGELLVWPSEIPETVLARNLRAGGVQFRTFRGNPERMFRVHG